MANVTVLGTGGSTVTISLTSAENAAVAQTALTFISKQITNGILDQVVYAGTGQIPEPTNLLGGVIIDKAADAGALGSNISAIVTGTGKSTVVGTFATNSTVVAADGAELTFLNLSKNANIVLGTGNHFIQQSTVGAGAKIAVDEGSTYIDTKLAGTNTTINAATKSLVLLETGGNVTVNTGTGADAVVALQGSGTVPVTVNAASGNLQYLALGGAALINPGNANVTVFGNVGAGRASVFGSPLSTGKLTVVDGQGEFKGGGAGGNLMFTSTVAGSATLIGGGANDLLVSQGANQVLIAGAGASTLTGRFIDESVGGSTFFGSGDRATIFGNTGGGNTFFFSNGITEVDGRDEAKDVGPLSQNTYGVAAAGGTHFVADFVSGTDKLISGGATVNIEFFAAGQTGSPFIGAAGTRVTLSGGTTIFFNDTGKDGVQDFKASDII